MMMGKMPLHHSKAQASIDEIDLRIKFETIHIMKGVFLEDWRKTWGDGSHIALIGRDVLSHCVFIYDGIKGVATLEKPDLKQ